MNTKLYALNNVDVAYDLKWP